MRLYLQRFSDTQNAFQAACNAGKHRRTHLKVPVRTLGGSSRATVRASLSVFTLKLTLYAQCGTLSASPRDV